MSKTKALSPVGIPEIEAKSLRTAELDLESIEDTYKRVKGPLEAKIKEGREKLLEGMIKTRIKSIKLESGDVYMRVSKTSFEVVDEQKALEWGKENNCLRLDKISANKLLTRTLGVPEGFEQKETEHISIKRAKVVINK